MVNEYTFDGDEQVRPSEQSILQEILTEQGEQINYQQQQLDGLSQCLAEITEILQQMRDSNPKAEIALVGKTLELLSNAVIDVRKQVRDMDVAQELVSLKSEQQALRKSHEKTREVLNNQMSNLALHLDWKRVSAIVFLMAILSSVCSVLITQSALNNSFGEINKEPATTKETPKSVKKKVTR